MLRLKRVELQGFKSFCDKTELRFNGSGIAAVVGPNGCGKSNLSDAICWVLGEQSARSLRGTRMEDVIFAGTRNRKPVGMASVTMTLVNPRIDPTITPDTPVEIKIVERRSHQRSPTAMGPTATPTGIERPPNGHTNGHTNGTPPSRRQGTTQSRSATSASTGPVKSPSPAACTAPAKANT